MRVGTIAIHKDDGTVEESAVVEFPTVAELAAALNCEISEIEALSDEDRGGLIFDLASEALAGR